MNKFTNYAGADYGRGQTNISKTGIRFGVISQNDVDMDKADCIWTGGVDLNYEAYLDSVKNALRKTFEYYFSDVNEDTLQNLGSDLRITLKDYFSDYRWTGKKMSELDDAVEAVLEATTDLLGDHNLDDIAVKAFAAIEQSVCDAYQGDESCMLWEDGDFKIQVDSAGDLWILKSPYYTHAQFCSPCAPGACHLAHPLDTPEPANKCYCLDHEWFENNKAPYPVYWIADGELVEPETE